MTVLIKFLWKSLFKKKAGTFLILFSVAASSALIFANEGFKRTVEYMFYEADTRFAGNSDICISTKTEAGAGEWIDTGLLEEYREELVYANSFQTQYALYAPNIEDMYYYRIYGVDMQEFQQHNPFGLMEGTFGDWDGYRIIMGEEYAEKYGFMTGDTITLELNGKNYDFTVAGIALQEGIYSRELADGGLLFAPKKTIAGIFGGETNLIYIKVKDTGKLSYLYDRLKQSFSDYEVAYALDRNIIETETGSYVLPFRISSVAVIFMSMFIIVTGYGLITNERISSLGILRSLGARRSKLNRLLLLESAGIGVVGGLSGCAAGIGILHFIKNTYFRDNGTFANSVPVVFGFREIITAVLAAVLITCFGALLQILNTTKLPVKEIMLHRTEQRLAKKSKLWMAAVVLYAVCIMIPPFLPKTFSGMIAGCFLATGVLFGLVFALPALTGLLAELAGKTGLPQEVYLGIRNVKDSKALSGNLKLFAAIIAIVAYMSTIFNTMSEDLYHSWNTCQLFDVRVTLRESDEESLKRVKAVDGVTDAAGYYMNSDCELPEENTFINMLYGIEDASFFETNKVEGLKEAKNAIDGLKDGNNLIATNILKAKLKLELGDVLRLRYQDREADFTVTGFVDTNWGIGHVAYISGDSYKSFIGAQDYDRFDVKGNTAPDILKLNLKREFTKDILTINTKEELRRANADKVDSIFRSVSLYTFIAAGIGILGMFNNITACFLERKRSLALYRCIGISRTGVSRMMFTEAVTVGLLGSLSGLGSAAVMMKTIPQAVEGIWGNVAVRPAATEITILLIAGVFFMITASLLPLRSSRKISIMESMKYE